MAYHHELARQGDWLFRWRSYLPLVALPLLGVALWQSGGGGGGQGTLLVSLGVALLGLAIRCATVGFVPGCTSGRNVVCQVADTLNTTGMYSLLRHPLYLGNILIYVGVAAATGVWWLALLVWLGGLIYYERIIMAEERFLRESHGAAWKTWAAVTPALLPNPRNWRANERVFCPRTVLRREYSGFFAIALAFCVVVHVRLWMRAGSPQADVRWLVFLVAALVVYLTLRTLKHKTRLLHVDGR